MSGTLAPTRMNLLRAARRLARVRKGVQLLRRKREALVTELFRIARPAADAREQIERRTRRAYPALLRALSLHGQAGLAALGWPARDVSVTIEAGSVWGIPVARLIDRRPLVRSALARGTAPGSTGPAAAAAATEFETLIDLLLDAAPREMLLRRLGEALARTSRQVNTLERRLAPQLAGAIAGVRSALEEREREEHLRLQRLRHRDPHRVFMRPSSADGDRTREPPAPGAP
jgi:V/A-type H+/Na+-transporting ATPase subunit D